MRALLVSSVLLVAGCTTIKDYKEPPINEPPGTVTGTTPVTQPKDCNNYEFKDQTYNCSQLDRCTEQDFQYRLACCDCDPTLCDPDPNCEPTGGTTTAPPPGAAESCMVCHNGSSKNDYAGPGMSNPHPFGPASQLTCTTCHGGNPNGQGKAGSHVPYPPQIPSTATGSVDKTALINDPTAYFNYLTLTGVDKYPDWTDSQGNTVTALDWLRFENPGDSRVVASGMGCGNSGCHGGEHADWAPKGFILNSQDIYASTLFSIGAEPGVPESAGLYGDTASDYGFRASEDPTWVYDPTAVGSVPRVAEIPEYAQYGDVTGFYNNPLYDANTLANYRYTAATDPDKVNEVIPGSPLQDVVVETVVFQCGNCHAGDKGANNEYGDFRSSGCTACHMNYSMDGRSRSTDPNVDKYEPLNPDAIAAPERSHVETHQIRNVAKILPNGAFVRGVADYACVGCHQGSNRTVLQYWGIRLDQNQDLVNNQQYPTNPVTFTNTANDTKLYDPVVQNNTFNGRNANQYIETEDYDGDGRDDTPADVHFEAGMGCIDCHGSRDVHNGTDGDPNNGKIWSRMGQSVGIECEDCHGSVDDTAYTTQCDDYTGTTRECGVDRFGNPLRNTYKDSQGDYWLISRLDGQRHYMPQIRYAVVNTNRVHPITGQALYDQFASYAMGRVDGTLDNGTGPQQNNPNLVDSGFSHMDNLSCDACHASWQNNCEGCHLQLTYNANPNNYFFSNTTGERITTVVTNADFTYILPNWFTLEITPKGQIGAGWPGMKPFYRYQDLNGNLVAGITFSDRNGMGDNPNYGGSGAFPALSHNRIAPHTIRAKQSGAEEGGKECVACHLNVDQIANFDANGEYTQYFADMENANFANLNFNLLQQQIGQNTNNQLNSPYYPHMVAGLGTGLLLADATGCPVNPLDNNANRQYCPNGAPAANFNVNNAVYDWDKVVEASGVSDASLTNPFFTTALLEGEGAPLRGSGGPGLSGPMNAVLLQKLADPAGGLILDSYVDANGNAQGGAANFIR